MKQVAIALMVVGFLASGCVENQAGVSMVKVGDLKLKTDENGYTSEQRNIIKRRDVAENPNQIMWIYCLAQNGQVIFYGPAKGKITSSGKKLDVNMVRGVANSAEMGDGTEGTSDAYVFWFDPSGKYFQWNGNYFLSTYEIKILNPVLNTRNVQ